MEPSDLPPPPDRLVGPGNAFPFGSYAGPLPLLNYDDFDFRLLGRRPWSGSRASARWLLKRWQFVGVIDERFVFGAAVVHLNYLGTGFAYLYDRAGRRLVEHNLKRPLAIGTRFSAGPADGTGRIGSGRRSIVFDNTPVDGRRTVAVDFGPEFSARFSLAEPGTGVTTIAPKGGRGFHCTYKSAGLLPEGECLAGGQRFRTGPSSRALFDWTASTPPRETRWNWASGAGTDQAGRSIAINLSGGLVGDGHSQNAVWIDGRPVMLGEAVFAFEPGRLLDRPWRVTTRDGAVGLDFGPEGERHEDVDLGLVVSRFHQPFGTFSGTIRLPSETLEVGLFGVCEDHLARW